MDMSHVCFTAPLAEKEREIRQPVLKNRSRHAEEAPPREREPAPLDPLIASLLYSAGLNPAAYRSTPLHRRIQACLRHLRVKDAAEASQLLARQPHLGFGALDAALIGVTDFFRDAPVFSAVNDMVLPALLKNGRPLRALSAGCSAGHELYSLAILLAESGALERSELVGIDCRQSAIERARAGFFDHRDIAAINETLRRRYFTAQGGGGLIEPRLRQWAEWEVADVMKYRAAKPFDLILYRNVAIYLEPLCGDVIWERLAAQLKPGGWMVTGKAERPPAHLGFERMAQCIYRKNTSTAQP
jgi:chemotaxis protein methyltransferase CheR